MHGTRFHTQTSEEPTERNDGNKGPESARQGRQGGSEQATRGQSPGSLFPRRCALRDARTGEAHTRQQLKSASRVFAETGSTGRGDECGRPIGKSPRGASAITVSGRARAIRYRTEIVGGSPAAAMPRLECRRQRAADEKALIAARRTATPVRTAARARASALPIDGDSAPGLLFADFGRWLRRRVRDRR